MASRGGIVSAVLVFVVTLAIAGVGDATSTSSATWSQAAPSVFPWTNWSCR